MFAKTAEKGNFNLAANVSERQTIILKNVPVFSVILDESVGITDITGWSILVRSEIHDELCCSEPSLSHVPSLADTCEESPVQVVGGILLPLYTLLFILLASSQPAM